MCYVFFFFKQKTAYEIKECDWSSDVCSSDLYAIIAVESSGNPDAKGSAGEIGLMQISNLAAMNVNQIYHTDFNKDNLRNPYDNILAGVMYLSIIHTYFPSWDDVIMAYNIGLGNVQRGKKISTGKRYLKRVKEYVRAYGNI